MIGMKDLFQKRGKEKKKTWARETGAKREREREKMSKSQAQCKPVISLFSRPPGINSGETCFLENIVITNCFF